jgi:mediator of RNA polymerase II transcription subunit 10
LKIAKTLTTDVKLSVERPLAVESYNLQELELWHQRHYHSSMVCESIHQTCAKLTICSEQMRTTVQTLYNIIVQIYDHQGAPTEAALQREITSLIQSLLRLSQLAPTLTLQIPPEVIEYVQDGRNPDIYTREFVELGMKNNQRLKGKADAFAAFRDVLGGEIAGAIPELEGAVKTVVEATGGAWDIKKEAA